MPSCHDNSLTVGGSVFLQMVTLIYKQVLETKQCHVTEQQVGQVFDKALQVSTNHHTEKRRGMDRKNYKTKREREKEEEEEEEERKG